MNPKTPEITLILAQNSLFRGLPTNQLEALASIAKVQSYRKGETLFWEGDTNVGFFIVVSGRVKVFKSSPDGKEQILQIFGMGEHFAEVPAFDGQPFPASAAALDTAEVLFFSRSSFLKLLEETPTLAIQIIAVFARHLRRFAMLIEDLSLKEVPARLAAYLLYLSEAADNSDLVELDITKTQLAAFLGTIPETLSRVFAKLAQEGIIEINGSKIQLLNRGRLTDLAQGKIKFKN
ncbi:Crp/Fnr family transcriptional regulator [Ancylothrix sp. C2]|uniref:Crp/Fnr family transcriptional regulator n=1 Tax=Ancylothrix sp. D3o TaxID=2953691 RepID=UPI0021BA5F1E|nr:Crp/Fnr family transcriptional regulator [Ancylothrix sp. D3o]MCT7950482.1 Crp/Fnr family transcriptional regulator [Ancylothrix sp. D3o]